MFERITKIISAQLKKERGSFIATALGGLTIAPETYLDPKRTHWQKTRSIISALIGLAILTFSAVAWFRNYMAAPYLANLARGMRDSTYSEGLLAFISGTSTVTYYAIAAGYGMALYFFIANMTINNLLYRVLQRLEYQVEKLPTEMIARKAIGVVTLVFGVAWLIAFLAVTLGLSMRAYWTTVSLIVAFISLIQFIFRDDFLSEDRLLFKSPGSKAPGRTLQVSASFVIIGAPVAWLLYEDKLSDIARFILHT